MDVKILMDTVSNPNILDYLLFREDVNPKDAVEIWSKILTALALMITTIWGFFTFRKNNKIKAAELLQKFEEDYKKNIPILLHIEYSRNTALKEAIIKVYNKERLWPDEDKLIEDFERALRHFFECYILHKKGLDSKLFNYVHFYYLNILCNGSRHEITTYILDFWPSVYRWYLSLALPWYYKLFLPFILDKDLPFPRIIEKKDDVKERKRIQKQLKPNNRFSSFTTNYSSSRAFISSILNMLPLFRSSTFHKFLLPFNKRKLLRRIKQKLKLQSGNA